MCIDTILMRRGKVLKRLHLGIALTCSCSLLMGDISVLHGKALEKTIRYQKQEDCFMCGNEDRSLFSLYNEGIGVLNLNNLEIYTLLPEEGSTGSNSSINSNGENKTTVEIDKKLYNEGIGVLNLNNLEIYTLLPEEGSTGSNSSINSNGENKTTVEIDKNNARSITDVTFRLNKGSKADAAEMGEIMCEDCVNSILKNNTYDMSFVDLSTREIIPLVDNMVEFFVGDYAMSFVDLSTREIIPLVDNMVEFFVGDYAIHKISGTMKEQDKTLEYLVFFAPETK